MVAGKSRNTNSGDTGRSQNRRLRPGLHLEKHGCKNAYGLPSDPIRHHQPQGRGFMSAPTRPPVNGVGVAPQARTRKRLGPKAWMGHIVWRPK